MNDLVPAATTAVAEIRFSLQPTPPAAIEKVRALTAEHLKHPQVPFVTEHCLHAGMYTRTVLMPAGSEGTGALVKAATMLFIQGDCEVYTGYETVRITGHAALPAAPNRKQAFHAYADTLVSMVFPSDAKSVAEAEAQFTDELDGLWPLSDAPRHQITITGD